MLVSHDLGVVRYLCDDVVVLHDGAIVERGTTADVLRAPSRSVHADTARRGAPTPTATPISNRTPTEPQIAGGVIA